jgi:hypothetical protein
VCVNYPVIRNFLITRQLGPINHGKKFVVDNIGPWGQQFLISSSIELAPCVKQTFCCENLFNFF